MSYHKVKMDEINDSIKTLWNTTYQGTGERLAATAAAACAVPLGSPRPLT